MDTKRLKSFYFKFRSMAGASLLLFGNIRKNRFLSPKRKKSFIGEGTYLDATATISPKGVNIGKNCVIKEHAVIYTNTEIGDNVTIMPGAVIGGQGFVYIKIRSSYHAVYHSGNVQIGSGAVIGSMTCIDKSIRKGATSIGENTVLEEGIHVAHNVSIGSDSWIGAGAMIAGHTHIGAKSRLWRNCSIVNRVNVGDGAEVFNGAVVTREVKPGDTVAGNFALTIEKFNSWMKILRTDSRGGP